MRQLYYIILTILIFSSCTRHRNENSLTRWTSCGIEQADDLCDSIFRDFSTNNGSGRELWLAPLESIGAANPSNKKLQARVSYWQVRRLMRLRRQAEALDTLSAAMARLDSARFTEDYRRLYSLGWQFDPNLIHRYTVGIDNLDYFRSIGDSVSMATQMMNLGDVMYRIGDRKRGLEYCIDAYNIWSRMGLGEYAEKSLVNVALLSDRQRADSIHRHLIANTSYRSDTSFYATVLRNHYLNTDSVEYLQRVIALTDSNPRLIGIHAINCALYSDWLSERNRFGEAIIYARRADSLRNPGQEPRFDMLMEHAKAMALNGLGMFDSAAPHFLKYVALKDTIAEQTEQTEIANAAARDKIHEIDLQRLVKAERDRRTVWIICMGLTILLLTVSFTLYRRAKTREIHAMLARQELQQAKSRLGRETILIQEKEELLKTLGREIEQSEADGGMNPVTSARLRNTLKVHNAARDERQAFLDVHDNLLPGFSVRLKEQFPELSEKQLKLAAYICAGMTSNAIGRVLNITPASVMKNRYRLRTKLGLQPGEVLEDFLRRFTE